jgi:hypothetical protein
MPDIESLMQEWPPEFEELLNQVMKMPKTGNEIKILIIKQNIFISINSHKQNIRRLDIRIQANHKDTRNLCM